ncbi:triose-phosphate isomerase [Phascolarctobacterium succinatutens]|uniref:Multifunctional fusion protein n=4 Tax=Phascolarctobacterium succinatutens TaxID=626940 RepID=A0A1Q6R1Q2_9FIRM|nr:triose-phosphate isomerase [Phascolarctobacterium succinatutens]MBS1362410.1 triose-phosphate isomerase [Acidaminococcaceae bacterium]MBS5427483.1 triose-phosphate isomerase [Phascolarctobacterium succinatutens]OLA36315.1 MAG: triose-phosphate isomerase [Phascolarctobacterium succinatutens]HAM92419.1 triose-phosphate isomerase [Phascolarctobacterium succinatutens]
MDKKTVRDLDVAGKKVLVRVDFNVPLNDKGEITDDTRITASLPTIQYLLEQKAAVILMAHLGRPKGQVKPELSLAPVAKHLGKLLGKKILFAPDCVGEAAQAAASKLKPGHILLLENLRFHKEEEKNDMEFAEKLASLADLYVNDGFGVSHRAHASVEGVTHFLPAAAGFLLEKEIQYVGQAVTNPLHPFVAIIGGAKVSDKIGVISNLLDKVDTLLIGGGMANTFLAAQGYKMGKSLVEEDKLDLAKELLAKAKKNKVNMLLPTDLVMAAAFAPDAEHVTEKVKNLNQAYMALDIGAETSKAYAEALADAKMIVWNGPMGVFEMDAFCKGTEAVAKAVAKSRATSIVGGGDSVAAIEKLGLAKRITHISTGGGASLEYLEGKVLPGVAALDDLRRKMIAGNWKMHKTVSEAVELAEDIVMETNGTLNEVVIFPPFTALETVADAIDGKHVGYGAQDLHWEDKGAFTGAVSGAMIADICAEYVLVGHSERRTIFGENEKIVASKIIAAYRNGLKPMLCVGENLAEREAGKTARKINMQLKSALRVISAEDAENLVVAYEPIWAIGSGKAATPEDALEVCTLIREKIGKIFTPDIARKVRILYGGSVNEKNAASFNLSGIDGVLVGGASLKADTFAAIVRSF